MPSAPSFPRSCGSCAGPQPRTPQPRWSRRHSRSAIASIALRRVRSSRSYLASVFQMSWMAFQVPSFCFFHVVTYLPFSVTILPAGPLNEAS